MQIQDFLRVYQAKSDEEILQLAGAADQLTSDAQFALHSELSRRQISIAGAPGTQKDADHCPITREGSQKSARQGVGDFVAEVLRTYRGHFWLFFTITAPAVIISVIAVTISRSEGREIARHIPRAAGVLAYRPKILEILLANSSAWLVSWMAFSFAFGAICIALEETAAGFTSSAWHSLLNIRERLSPFLRLSLLLLVMMLLLVVASALLFSGVLFAWSQWHYRPSRFLIGVLSYGLVGLAILFLSRLALAIPAVILDDCTVRDSIFRNKELTRGRWPELAALLAKSLIGGYVAGMCPFWLASFASRYFPLPVWFPWVLTTASIIGVSLIEPTMFVGFALLYLKLSAPGAAQSRVPAAQFV
jgi:hypothetical protein